MMLVMSRGRATLTCLVVIATGGDQYGFLVSDQTCSVDQSTCCSDLVEFQEFGIDRLHIRMWAIHYTCYQQCRLG